MDRLNAFGAVLSTFGAILATYSYFLLDNIPLTALGIGSAILGLSILLTPSTPIPKKTVRALIEGAALNLEALLEEVGATAKAIYVPYQGRDIYAYIPMASSSKPPSNPSPPRGVVVEINRQPYLAVIPPASRLTQSLEATSLEAALWEALVDVAELCESVKVATGTRINIEAKKPRIYLDAGRFQKVLGSLIAMTAACVAAKILQKPIQVEDEAEEDSTVYITLKVVEE